MPEPRLECLPSPKVLRPNLHLILNLLSSAIGAVVGPKSGSWTITGQYTSSLHGERLAAIAALMVTKDRPGEDRLLLDHLSTVQLAGTVRSPLYRLDTWKQQRAGHELYAWLVSTLKASNASLSHVKAHTEADDDDSKMNDLADKLAKDGHGKAPKLPPLTGWMRDYVMFVPELGYTPDNWLPVFKRNSVKNLLKLESEAMSRNLRDPETSLSPAPSTWWYHKAPYGLIPKYQLILRTNQFYTRSMAHRNGKVLTPECDLCGAAIQDEELYTLPLFPETAG